MNDRLKNLLATIFDMKPSEINASLTQEQIYKWDSLTHMELITSLEKEFQTEFSMEEIVEMTSITNIISLLETRGITHA